MRRVLLIINGKASQATEAYELAAKTLQELGCTVVRGEPKTCADYTPLIKKHRGDIDVVAVGGGDGTLQCAAEGLMATGLPLGVIPLGTANNVARSLGLPMDIPGACRVIAEGIVIPMDLAKVNDRLFVSVVGIGFSTEVHKAVPSAQKKRWGSISYAFQAIKLLNQKRKGFRVEIETDDHHRLKMRALQVTVVNGRFYGAHVEVNNDATLQDGMLDVSLIGAKRYFKGFFRALLPTKSTHQSPGLRIIRAKSLTITTHPVKELDVEGATDLRTPAKFSVLPGAISVIVGNG